MAGKLSTKEKLANAAKKVFARKGYHIATMNDISRAAGIAKGTIYLYIRHKEDLITLIAEQEVDSLLAHLREIQKSVSSPSERLRKILHFLVERVREYERTGLAVMMRDLYGVKAKVRADVYKHKQKLLDFFAEIFTEGIQKGEFRPIDVTMPSYILFAFVGSLVHQEMRLSIDDVEAFVETFLDIYLYGVKKR
ncbi:MAG: TetR/AcrR family transcriptional regulator [bacterium]